MIIMAVLTITLARPSENFPIWNAVSVDSQAQTHIVRKPAVVSLSLSLPEAEG